MSDRIPSLLERFSARWPEEREDYRRENDDSWKTYATTLRDLVAQGEPAPVERGLTDHNQQVRAICARALGFMESRRSVAALADTAKNDPWATVRLLAVDSLGMVGDPAAREASVICPRIRTRT